MAEGLGSLASGFLAGFQTMNDYQRGKKADERADKLMGLRELESQRDHEYKQWNMGHTESRAKRQDFESDRTFGLDQEKFKHGVKVDNETLNLRKRQESRLAGAQQFEELQAERQYNLNAYGAVAARVLENPTLMTENPQYQELFKLPGLEHLNPLRHVAPERIKANETAFQHAKTMTDRAAKGEFDNMSDQEVAAAINTPEVTAALDTLWDYEFSKAVGRIDPSTGRQIVDQGNPMLIPGPSGQGFFIRAETTYRDADGNLTKEYKPITMNRSAEEDDNPREIPYSQLFQQLGNNRMLTNHLQQSGITREMAGAMGYTEQPDTKWYRKNAATLIEKRNEQLAELDKDAAYASSIKDKDERERKLGEIKAQEQAINQRYEAGVSELRGLAGMTSSSKGQEKQRDPLAGWAGNDPGRQQFLQALAERGELKALADDPELIDMAYQRMQLQAQEQQQNAVAAGIEERIAGKGGQQKQGWTGATPSLGSAPSLREAMDIPPGDVRTTEKEFINAVARPYLNNATPGNQPAAQGRLADAWRNAYPSINR